MSRRPRTYPVFRELTTDEITGLLARNHVGRLAFTFHDRVDLEPLHYVYDDGWIYVRTAGGSKLTTLAHHPWVAFEVDEVEDTFRWRSVVVRGTARFIDPEGSPLDRFAYARALELLRGFLPETLTEQDPVPHRDVFLRIHLDEATGRAAEEGT